MKGIFRYRNIQENKYTRNILIYSLWSVLFPTRYFGCYDVITERFGEFLSIAFGAGAGICLAGLWLLMIYHISSDESLKNRKIIMEKGECYDGEIVGCIVKKVKYEEFGWNYQNDMTYMLQVKCRGEIITTPEFSSDPERVLNSKKCHVYYYGDKKYVTDFDERFFRIGKKLSLKRTDMEVKGKTKIKLSV